jgi:hypothetical protein
MLSPNRRRQQGRAHQSDWHRKVNGQHGGSEATNGAGSAVERTPRAARSRRLNGSERSRRRTEEEPMGMTVCGIAGLKGRKGGWIEKSARFCNALKRLPKIPTC